MNHATPHPGLLGPDPSDIATAHSREGEKRAAARLRRVAAATHAATTPTGSPARSVELTASDERGGKYLDAALPSFALRVGKRFGSLAGSKWFLTTGLLTLCVLSLTGCGLVNQSDPACSGNLHEYKGKCLTNTAIVYVECVEGRGMSTTTQLGASQAGSFKVVAKASLNLAYKRSEKEDTPVALQVVHDCLKLAEQASDDVAEQGVARDYEQQVSAQIAQWQTEQVQQTPHISLSTNSASAGERIVVSGRQFWPSETVDIYLHATLLKQVPADKAGRFTTSIDVPVDAPHITTTISATGETSAKTAQAPFRAT